MSELIVVIGVTGLQGSSVAKTFSTLPGWRVRGITRNPSSDSAQSLSSLGIDIVKGDLDDVSTLMEAFTGATAIFANTDFFAPFIAALMSPDTTGGLSPAEYAYAKEVQQGSNIAQAAATKDVLATLKRFVWSSLCDASKLSHGKYTHVYHNESKTEVIRVIQKRYPDLFARMSTVQIGHYVQNWKAGIPAFVPQRQVDGSFVMQHVFSPDFKIPYVVPDKDAGAFVKALVVDLPVGKNLLGVSSEMTIPEYAKLWGETLGVKCSYKQIPMQEFFKGVPEAFQREMGETFAFAQEFGFAGGDPEVLTPEQFGIHVPVTPLEDYIRNEQWPSLP